MPQWNQWPWGSSTCSSERVGCEGFTDLREVIDDGLDDLAAAADVGVGEAALEAVKERPVDEARLFLELARRGLAGRFALLDAPLGEFPLGARIPNGRRVQDQVQEYLGRLPGGRG